MSAITGSLGHADAGPALAISLQEPADTGGYTDLELRYERLHLILEAKRGWALPTLNQLARYQLRFTAPISGVLLVVSEASRAYALPRLPVTVDGVPVQYMSWPELISIAIRCTALASSHADRRVVKDLVRYLRGAVRMQDPFSTWTYCVSVSHDRPNGGTLSFRQVVDNGFYFHPYGTNWPKNAPPFLAFRWQNAVQRIHHVDDYRIVDRLNDVFPEIPDSDDEPGPHIVYTLGPNIGPPTPLPSGTTYRASRLWVALDLLLTSATLQDAVAATKQRRRGATAVEPA